MNELQLTENFCADQISQIGIEVEFQLLDKESLDLADRITPLLEVIGDDPCIGPEVFQSSIEIKTQPTTQIGNSFEQLKTKLEKVKEQLDPLSLRLCSLGVHPFSHRISATTNQARYLSLERDYPYITHHHSDFATHVHVSMDSLEQSIHVMNELRKLLPVFIALSASCPFWQEELTGFASFRQYITKTNFNAGIPPHFEDHEAFIQYFQGALKAGAIKSLKDIHWDIKPRPDFGTLELRVMDAVPKLEETIALCTLAYCTMRALQSKSLGELLPSIFKKPQPNWAESINHFQASLRGIEACYITSSEGDTLPLRELVQELIFALEGQLTGPDELTGLKKVKAMLQEGLPYQRVLKVYEETNSFRELVKYAADEVLP